jgi:sortase (surface protein transpeptidase)
MAENSTPSDLQNVETGSRIAVYWTDDGHCYEATVIRKLNKNRPFCLEDDDGDSA